MQVLSHCKLEFRNDPCGEEEATHLETMSLQFQRNRILSSGVYPRGLRVQHFCYPTRTRSTGPLPVPDPYSKLLPDPTRTRGYTRTRHCQAFPCIVYVPTRLIVRHVGM